MVELKGLIIGAFGAALAAGVIVAFGLPLDWAPVACPLAGFYFYLRGMM